MERLQLGAQAKLSVRPEHVELALGEFDGCATDGADGSSLPLQRLDEIFTNQNILIVGRIGGALDFRISLKAAQMPQIPSAGALPVRWRAQDALVFAGRPGGH